MSRFQLREIRLDNYRCFEELRLPLEEDTTVLFAENGGGKTALLTALAMGLAVFQRGSPKSLKFDAGRDLRRGKPNEEGLPVPEPAGPGEATWTAAVGETESVTWSTAVQPTSGRTRNQHRPILAAVERVRAPGARWPLFAWYGVDRLRRLRGRRRIERMGDRREAYDSSLDPNLDEARLLQWLQDEFLGDAARRREEEPERLFHAAVMEATVRAAPDVTNAWYDAVTKGPVVRFENGHVIPWSELSGGHHAFIALVADIARRAIMLNEIDGAEAPAKVEGVVLIDALDLHLPPRCQRVVLRGLRRAFPRLQLIVTTHSPQVLSSAENRQVRRLFNGKLQEGQVFVEGRDTNAILREYMGTDDRDDRGVADLRRLHKAIDQGNHQLADRIHQDLSERWGVNDPALIRAREFMEE